MRCLKSIAVNGLLLVALAGCSAQSDRFAVPVNAVSATSTGSGLAPYIQVRAPSFHSAEFDFSNTTTGDLYISDFVQQSIGVFAMKSYNRVGVIHDGINDPNGLWTDTNKNLYAANSPSYPSDPNGWVAEYAPKASSPTCLYTTGMVDPVALTVDQQGDLYVADWNFGGNGAVDRYSQCSNKLKTQYAINGSPGGVAVDATGNLFVLYNSHLTGAGALEEFPPGSTNPIQLKATVHFAGGLIMDPQGDLLASDQGAVGHASSLDRIAPPYSRIAHKFTGFGDAFHAALLKNATLLFVADPKSADVQVLDYPSGSVAATISGQGLYEPAGVALSNEFTP